MAGIAHFWQFPHSQIYAETERLARVGLLAEEREQTGRRRRSYRITAGGRAVLAARLAEPTDEALQVRSLGLLKLFFSQTPSRRTSPSWPGSRPSCSAAGPSSPP